MDRPTITDLETSELGYGAEGAALVDGHPVAVFVYRGCELDVVRRLSEIGIERRARKAKLLRRARRRREGLD